MRLVLRFSIVSVGLYGMSVIGLVAWQHLAPLDLPIFESREAPLPSEIGSNPDDAWLVVPDRVRRGDTLATVLLRNGFNALEVHQMAAALTPHFNPRHLRPGDEVEIRYADSGDVEAVWIHRGTLETYEIRSEPDGWVGDQLSIVIEHREIAHQGSVQGSLFESLESMGESAPLVIAFAEVFQWDFDFYTQSRPGDRFSFLVEKLYRDDRFAGYGDLLAARYVSGHANLSAFLFVDPDGKNKGYYDPNGKSMRKAFLRAPLKFQRISSRFSYSRLHPVHRRRMPHLGVDYAAPQGTPVHSVAAGTVTGISTKGGSGRMVTIRHAMGYESKYLHLSRFAKGLRTGKRVAQKQVIGYVGSTGLATGPHLDFRLIRHGKPANPLKQIYPPGPPVAVEHMDAYLERVKELAARMSSPSACAPQKVDPAVRGLLFLRMTGARHGRGTAPEAETGLDFAGEKSAC